MLRHSYMQQKNLRIYLDVVVLRIVPELEDPRFREVIYGNYRIVYRIIGTDDDIEILAVIHGARDLKRAFREEWELS
jgi:plasmid stabilization system protein ParE